METVVLFIIGCAILLLILSLRYFVKARQMSPLSKRLEAVIRIALCLICSAIVFLYFHSIVGAGRSALLTIAASAFLIYGITHLFDRLVLGD